MFHGIAELWLNPSSYSFFSSSFPECLFTILCGVIVYLFWRPIRRHLECSEGTCHRLGHPVHGTGYRACHEHHPAVAHEPGEAVTVDHIAEAHRDANS